jgi:uncharacterized protein YcaQ
MADVRHLSLTDARRIAVRAQLLDLPRPTDLLTVVRRLTLLQLDPTAAVAPSADLVAWSRLGSSYQHADLQDALEQERSLFELDAMIRPAEDLALYLPFMATFPHYEKQRVWLEANRKFQRDVLARIREAGPLLSRDIPDTAQVPWQSRGWTHDRNVTQMVEFLGARGDIAIAGRAGSQRLWDLAERVYPKVPKLTAEEARAEQDRRRLRGLGIARARGRAMPLEPVHVGENGLLAQVEGVKGTWRVHPDALDGDFVGRTALLSPFDRLIYDRDRARDLFDFEYILEMYKPAEKRRWGYFALPILHEDQLIGKADLTADRKAGVLRVNALHEDVRFTKPMVAGIRGELDDLAVWLGLERAA